MALSRRERREQRKQMLKEERLKQIGTVSQSLPEQPKKGFLLDFYDKHYMALLVIPIALFILAAASVAYQVATTGDFIVKGTSLKGGLILTIPVDTPVDIDTIHDLLQAKLPSDDLDVRSISEFGLQKAIMVSTDNPVSEQTIIDAVESISPGSSKSYSSETTGSTLGSGFFSQTALAMMIAFAFMSLVVFISFRTFVPSAAVIIAVLADIIETVAAVNLVGLKVSTAGLAAFLMLIGYSVDTDILLTSRVLRSKQGTVFDRIIGAAKTGIFMTLTALVAVIVAFFMTDSPIIKEIMTILIFGLAFDLVNTWIQNAAILRWYAEKKGGTK